jgi:heptosyltransferase-2
MSVPALQALRAAYPEAHIGILARPWVAGLYAREPFCDQILLHEAARGWGAWREIAGLARVMKRQRFDMAVLLQNAFEAAAIAWLAGIPRRVGYARDGRGQLLTDAVTVPAKGEIPAHERFYYLEMLKRARIIGGYSAESPIRLSAAEAAREAGRIAIKEAGLPEVVVGVAPGAAFGGAKRWLPERFAESALTVARELDAGIALFGSAAERPACDEIESILDRSGVRVRNFSGETTLIEFVDLVAACRVLITNDSGPMHVASALGVPLVAVFGATNHLTTGPASEVARVVREPVDCSPCMKRECPIDHRCMTRVTAGRVAQEALDLVRISS